MKSLEKKLIVTFPQSTFKDVDNDNNYDMCERIKEKIGWCDDVFSILCPRMDLSTLEELL